MSSKRYADVARVLTRVLFLNLVVAVAKIAFGYASGAISILSDGFHSLTDTASNVVGLVGGYAARRPPDDDHPYGHRKYETVAAVGVGRRRKAVGEIAQVAAGAEHSPRAADGQCADAGVGIRGVQRLVKPGHHFGAQRVALFRLVEGDQQEGADALDPECGRLCSGSHFVRLRGVCVFVAAALRCTLVSSGAAKKPAKAAAIASISFSSMGSPLRQDNCSARVSMLASS